jgi:hypothetical protein
MRTLVLSAADLVEKTKGWMQSQCPAEFVVRLDDHVDQWHASGETSVILLMAPILRRFCQLSSFDYEIAACKFALTIAPQTGFFQIRLAQLLHLSGDVAAARLVLAELSKPDSERYEAIFLSLALSLDEGEAAAILARLAKGLLSDRNWQAPYHEEFVRLLIDRHGPLPAKKFLEDWRALHPVPILARSSFGVAAIHAGMPEVAGKMFSDFWQAQGSKPAPLFGPFNGTIEPYSDAVAADLAQRIDDAKGQGIAVMPSVPTVPMDQLAHLKVAFVSFSHQVFPNDLAEHLSGSAACAKVNLAVYLDSALVQPITTPLSDADVEQRINSLSLWLDDNRPDVLILDCLPPIGVRGLNVGRVAELKSQFGFKLICMMRDAHAEAVDIARAWLPLCDTLLLFDPLSPIFEPQYQPMNAKALAMVVPAFHGPFLDSYESDQSMIFIGSIYWQPRAALMSILMTQDYPFRTIYGEQRKIKTADTTSYARALGQSLASLNVSIHGDSIHLITGRVWETIAVGALLVEQDNEAIKKFLVPYRHYLPWSSISDIVHIGQFIAQYPDKARAIAREAKEFVLAHYGPVNFWHTVLAHVTRAQPDENADLAGQAWPVIPDNAHVAKFDRLLRRFC